MGDTRQVSFTLKNDRSEELPVFVEPWPEYYKLRNGEVLKIDFVPSTDVAEVIEVVSSDERLTIYPNFVDDAEITIDGKDAADRSWPD